MLLYQLRSFGRLAALQLLTLRRMTMKKLVSKRRARSFVDLRFLLLLAIFILLGLLRK